MKKEKDEIKLKGKNKEKALNESTITLLNSFLQKNGHARHVNENRQGYENPRSNSILNPYNNPGRSPCKGPPGRTRSPGIAYDYFTEHPPNSEKKLNTAFNSKPLLLKNNSSKFKFLHFINT